MKDSSYLEFILVPLFVVGFLWIVLMICKKAGFSHWWIILLAIPFAQVILWWVFAFVKWSAEELDLISEDEPK